MKQHNGAIPLNRLHRWFHRKLRSKLPQTAAGLQPFNWAVGYDVRDTIGAVTIKNQGGNDSCGGQAGSYFTEIQRRLNKITEGAISAKSIYSPIAYPGGGTTVPSLETQLGLNGANLEDVVPSYDIYGNPLTEALIASTAWRTPALTTDALTRAGSTPYDIASDINSIAAAIEAYGAVILEITAYANPTWVTAYPVFNPYNSKTGKFSHFLCACGAKTINGQQYLIILESEGVAQGDQGIQYLNQAFFTAGGVVDSFTMIADSHIVALPPNLSWWTQFLGFFHTLFAGLTGKQKV